MRKENLSVTIRTLPPDEPAPEELLHLADESPESVGACLARGVCRIARFGERTVGVSVLLRTRPFTMELAALAVTPGLQGRGIGRQLIADAVRCAREAGCRILEVGTGNSGIGQLALYQKCGFSIVSVDTDYFRRHYPRPIVENGIECRHMIRMRMELEER